ncbi:right-handed parallel beta-helix repeat-containing protein [Kineococcus indalonis]|uniref:hypothetical protein n=1 Tax=Kineococcus indalonis TaxID=2696566 RepID=UPI001412FB6F|nr:hypothetical protein [Kineococcus indalonis]NAZ88598.1 hypothetical protein [Kineococcus indalonis]
MRHGTAATAATAILCAGLAPGASAAPPRPAAPPRAATVPCGAVLTTSVRLAADVVCPDGRGLTLAADGVELNLNGHALTGPGRGDGSVESGPTGVRVAADGVVVRGGRISGWGAGVSGRADVTAPEDLQEPYADAVLRAAVRDVHLRGNGHGAEALEGVALTLQRTRLSGNVRGAGAYGGGRLLVEDSTAERNGTGLYAAAVPRDGLVLRDVLVRRNTSHGVSCSTDGHLDATGVTFQRNGTGLEVFLCAGRLAGSAFVWNGRHVSGYLSAGDVFTVTCTTATRDGGPLDLEGLAVQPCAPVSP